MQTESCPEPPSSDSKYCITLQTLQHMCVLQVVGGRYIQGRYGAVIEKVKQGSVADLAGRLLPGDEVSAALQVKGD